MLLVQGLVLVFTAVVWWIARRDIAARIPPSVPGVPLADTAELEQLCATLESLVVSLSERLEAVEARLPKPKAPKAAVVKPAVALEPVIIPKPVTIPEPAIIPEPVIIPEPAAELPVAAEPLYETPHILVVAAREVIPEPPPETRYAPVYALLALGLSDPVEIARQTGLGRGEVDLILSLRDRRVL